MTLPRERTVWLARNVVPHEGALRAWLLNNRSPIMDVDDIVQETYAILVALETVDHIRNPKAYVFQTARSVLLRQLRRDRVVRFQPLPDDDSVRAASDEASPEAVAILRDDLRRADALLATMPDRMREAFVMRRVDGLSQREIARRMSVSENTVEKHIGKALKLVMQVIGDANGGKSPAEVSSPPTRSSATRGTGRTRTTP